MKKVPVATLKASLAAHLAEVKAGRSFLITDRGRPVAVLGPVVWDFEEDETLKALVLAGQVTPASDELPRAFFRTPRVRDPENKLRTFLDEERRGGW